MLAVAGLLVVESFLSRYSLASASGAVALFMGKPADNAGSCQTLTLAPCDHCEMNVRWIRESGIIGRSSSRAEWSPVRHLSKLAQ
jgi:hypothetical protein